MGKCSFCGKKAGFLKSKHKQCETKYHQGRSEAIERIKECISREDPGFDLIKRLTEISEEFYIPKGEFNGLTTTAFDERVDEFLEDGLLDEIEESAVKSFQTRYKVKQEILDRNGSLQKVGMAGALRELENTGTVNQRMKIDGHLPFNFQKSESLIWVFQDVECFELKTRTEYRGGSSGVSIRIAKGVYYRASSFRGRPVKIEEMKSVGKGLVALTTKHIYFGSELKTFRIPYGKIIRIDPYEDGIGLQKDGVSAKPQTFKGVDGWFVSNVISHLS